MPRRILLMPITSRQILSVTNCKGLFKAHFVCSASSDYHSLSFQSRHQYKPKLAMQASGTREDHLMRTSNNSRDTGIHNMIVKAVNSLSPTIKEVVLAPEKLPSPFTFKAGQWVDVFIPNVNTVGGFSMCSSPQELTSLGQLRLAIKFSTHPPALWIHEKCRVGDKLSVRVGGDFFVTREEGTLRKRAVLLVAGGVGINPLSSMIHYLMNEESDFRCRRLCLLYSAKSESEFIYKDDFDNYYKTNTNDFKVKYFVTGKSLHNKSVTKQESLHYERISSAALKSAVAWLTGTTPDLNDVDAFICGPPSMIANISDALNMLSITSIHFEKWW